MVGRIADDAQVLAFISYDIPGRFHRVNTGGEDVVDLLERHVGQFGIEEVQRRYERVVEDREDQICLPLDPVDDDWRDHDDEEIPQPDGGYSESVSFGADMERQYFWPVYPVF